MARKSTVRKMADAVKGAALSVVHAADDHVVHPVGEALGFIKRPELTGKEKKAARKELVKAAEGQKKVPVVSTMNKPRVAE